MILFEVALQHFYFLILSNDNDDEGKKTKNPLGAGVITF
jgi:hypothetical protein